MKVILFTERNSPYGIEFLKKIYEHEKVASVMLVTRKGLMPFDYYQYDNQIYEITETVKKLNVKHIEQDDFKDEMFISVIKKFNPDLMIIGNFQKKLNAELCNLAKKGAFNFHPSPLPRYAGLAPFFWMAMNSERLGGVSCCKVSDIIDGGDIIAQYTIELKGNENTFQIRECHFQKAYELLDKVLYDAFYDRLIYSKQNLEERTYYSVPTDEHLDIHWSDSTQNILNIIRAASPLPGAIVKLTNNTTIRVTDADAFFLIQKKATPGTIKYFQNFPIIATLDGWIRVKSVSSIGIQSMTQID